MKEWFYSVLVTCMLAMPALADWNLGDPYKMHYPQLPDPNGWDVNITRVPGQPPYRVVADDFRCSESGAITDVHFWGSWQGDVKGQIEAIELSFYSDDPAGTGGSDPTNNFSKPDKELWLQSFHTGEFTERFWGTGMQGWYDPFVQQFTPQDHTGIYQYNITNINVPGAFEQVAGEIYWLGISVRLAPQSSGQFGWKTSGSPHFMDDATWVHLPPTGDVPWRKLSDPVTAESLDMAFVVTPEPAFLSLIAIAGLSVTGRRR